MQADLSLRYMHIFLCILLLAQTLFFFFFFFFFVIQDEPVPYSFFVYDKEITDRLDQVLDEKTLEGSEQVLDIIYQPQAVFRVRAVTRCTSSIPGHAEAVIAAQFSPDGRLVYVIMSVLHWVISHLISLIWLKYYWKGCKTAKLSIYHHSYMITAFKNVSVSSYNIL